MAYEKGLILIPARYNSHRLPGKALKDIAGKTMIRRTYERCVLSGIHTMVVTDDKRIVNECLEHAIPIDIVTEQCLTGTDRVARCAKRNPQAEWIINVQGDEPFANPEDIIKVADQMNTGNDEVVHGMSLITNPDDFWNTTIPKVIVWDGYLKYISRAPIPYPYGPNMELWKRSAYQAVHVFGFWPHHLDAFMHGQIKSRHEEVEDIEILRFMEMGVPVRMLELKGSPLHVDTPADLERAQLIAKEYDA